MQTFLPYPDFKRSAESLDRLRLGKQRVETLQLLRALLGMTTGWRNHPAAKMWKGHEHWLRRYGYAVCDEWIRRGYRDGVKLQLEAMSIPESEPPTWLGDERLHYSHRCNLVRKAPDVYLQHGWEDKRDTPYWWPV